MPAARRRPRSSRPCPHRVCDGGPVSPALRPALASPALCQRSGVTGVARSLVSTGLVLWQRVVPVARVMPAASCHSRSAALPTPASCRRRLVARVARFVPTVRRCPCSARPRPLTLCLRPGVTHVARGLDPTGFISATWRRPHCARPCPYRLRASAHSSPAWCTALPPPASYRRPGVASIARDLGPNGFVPAARRRPRRARPCPYRVRAGGPVSLRSARSWPHRLRAGGQASQA